MKHVSIITLMAITLLLGAPTLALPLPLDFKPATYTLGGFPRAASLEDIDADGDMDIAVTNPLKQEVIILLNKGDGTFEDAADNHYPVEGYPISVIAVDIDGDSDIDLVVLDSDGMVRVFKQGEEKDEGGDSLEEDIDRHDDDDDDDEVDRPEGLSLLLQEAGGYSVEQDPFSVSLSDLDSDEDVDLVILSPKATTILVNDGEGGFDTRLTYRGGPNSYIRISADLNGDLADDIVMGDMEGLSILINNGDDTFAREVYYATGDMPLSVTAGDMDSDGDNDLVVANYNGDTVSILSNNGEGIFEALNIPSPESPTSITLGDIDSDEDLDIIVTNAGSGVLSILVNNTVRPISIITESSLPQGQKGLYYETMLEAEGGVPPYNWTVISGKLPPSLSLDPSTGKIVSISEHEMEGAGDGDAHNDSMDEDMGESLLSVSTFCYCLKAPSGLYRFTVQATDSVSNNATADFYIEVLPTPGIISGKINYSGDKKGQIRIGLWPTTRSGGMGAFIQPLYTTAITIPGEYKIENIYPETQYLVAAYLDANGNGRREMDEPYGTYKKSGSGEETEVIMVDNAGALADIDIEIVDREQ